MSPLLLRTGRAALRVLGAVALFVGVELAAGLMGLPLGLMIASVAAPVVEVAAIAGTTALVVAALRRRPGLPVGDTASTDFHVHAVLLANSLLLLTAAAAAVGDTPLRTAASWLVLAAVPAGVVGLLGALASVGLSWWRVFAPRTTETTAGMRRRALVVRLAHVGNLAAAAVVVLPSLLA
jgi:hypothetical protein